MPRKDTPRFKFAYGWLRGEDYWGDPTSVNRVMHDALLHPNIRSMTIPTPPPDAVNGDQFIIPPDATDDWEGEENNIAMLVELEWVIIEVIEGIRVRVKDVGFRWFNGTEWVIEDNGLPPEPGTPTRYDIGISVGFAPEPVEALMILPVPQSMVLPAAGAGSLAHIDSPLSSPVILSLLRNGVQIGTITFNIGEFNGVIDVPGDMVYATGDRIKVVCPAVTMPANFKNFGIMLRLNLL